jgi:hypothetical protein
MTMESVAAPLEAASRNCGWTERVERANEASANYAKTGEASSMSATASTRAKIVRVKVEEGKAGLFYATSPDLRGLLVAEPNIDDLDIAISKAITDIYAASGETVVVTKAQDDDPEFFPWVAIPAEVAESVIANRSRERA